MITYSPRVSRSLLIEWTHMIDEDRTAGLDSFNNNNNANFPLYICNIHFELTVYEQQQSQLTRLKKTKMNHQFPCFTYLSHARSLCEHPKFCARTHALSLPVRTPPNVYRLIGTVLIGNVFDAHFLFKIQILVECKKYIQRWNSKG